MIQYLVAALKDERTVGNALNHVLRRAELRDVHGKAEFLHPGFHGLEAFLGNRFIRLALWIDLPDLDGEALEFRQAVRQDVAIVRQGDGGERHAMRCVRISADGLSEHVDHPVRALAFGNQCVECPGRRPHQVAARLVVLRILVGNAAGMQHRAHQALADVVARRIVCAGEILLANVVEDIVDAGHHLTMRQRHRVPRVQDGEARDDLLIREDMADLLLRLLIGDDEHGWDDNGVFNFEGGCYAKVIGLDKESEPDIYNAIRRDALLENVTVADDGKIDFEDKSVTENTRVSYPINHITNIVKPVSSAPAAKNVIFLSADAFGVLPPVSILTPEQTQYYFLSGFTAKLAGTERGITEPTPTFSACFGQAFLELHPTKYAAELVKKMEKSGAKAYLVNTGWNGTGKRISIKDTRGIIDAILSGAINTAPTKKIPMFNFEVPTELPGVDPAILDPRDTYADASEWETKAKDLAARFNKNFVKYTGNEAGKALVAAGPQL